jgi:hypothetical protein
MLYMEIIALIRQKIELLNVKIVRALKTNFAIKG